MANAAGDRVTPTVVAWSNNSSEVMVGLAAKQFAVRNPRSAVMGVNKHIFGTTTSEEDTKSAAEKSGKESALILVDAEKPSYDIDVNGQKKRISPEAVLVLIFEAMKGKP